MDEFAKPHDGRRIHGPPVVMTTVLSLAAVASLCGGALAAMIVLVAGQRGGKMNLDHVLVAGGLMVVGMLAGDFARADRGLDMLQEKVPGDEQIEPLRQQLHDARRAVRDEEVAAATLRAIDLMATGAFEQATTEVLAMAQRYPDEPAVASLLDRVRREGRAFNDERRDRMYNEVVRLAEARQWRQALGEAQRYVQAYPTGPGPDEVRAMLATIEDNARIEEVRELRDQIRDLIERRRYAEAVECARDVIDRFPDTRAAEELGRQMNRLRELARLL